jgi:hypothetical protein
MLHCPEHWQDEFQDARKDVSDSIRRDEFTIEEWITALS